MKAVIKLPRHKLNLAPEKYFGHYKLDLNLNDDFYPDARLSRIMDYGTNYKNIRWDGERRQAAKIKIK